MPYQFNIRVNIIREFMGDDGAGGATVTGTVTLYSQEPTRMDSYMPSIALQKQFGIETERTYTFFFHTNWQHVVNIRENDVIQIVFPFHHPLYLKRFRVRGHQPEASHPTDARGVMEVTCTRIDYSRTSDSI